MDFQGRKRERGFIALAVLFLFVISLAVHWVRPLPSHNRALRQQHNAQVLHQAREALLGYALTYPDRVNARFGPGYLPCPARDQRGIAAPGCASASGSNLGRFPWHTLRTNELLDSSGAGLWYAVADSHRYNPKRTPMNSAAAGDQALADDAVVAVVIAPGPPLRGQHLRRRNARNAAQFVESVPDGENLSAYRRQKHDGQFNDEILTLTARQLMRAAEHRAMREISARLTDYANRHAGEYPWLTAADPAAPATPVRTAAHNRGRLLYHYYDADAVPKRGQTFVSDVVIRFELNHAHLALNDADGLIPKACLLASPCVFNGHRVALQGPAQCQWWTPQADIAPRAVAHCEYNAELMVGAHTIEYALSILLIDDDGMPQISGPDPRHWRTRTVRSDHLAQTKDRPASHAEIRIRVREPFGSVASAVITVDGSTSGSIEISGIRYALDVNHAELPSWLISAGWLDLAHVAVADAGCQQHGRCLTIRDMRGTTDARREYQARALLLSAGSSLDRQARWRAAPRLSDWFEIDNASAPNDDVAFIRAPLGSAFNDQLQIIEPAP